MLKVRPRQGSESETWPAMGTVIAVCGSSSRNAKIRLPPKYHHLHHTRLCQGGHRALDLMQARPSNRAAPNEPRPKLSNVLPTSCIAPSVPDAYIFVVPAADRDAGAVAGAVWMAKADRPSDRCGYMRAREGTHMSGNEMVL